MSHQEKGGTKRWRSDGRGGKHKHTVGERGKEVLEKIDESLPVIKYFRQYALELDAKHDKYERIVKLSRDCTIVSKRVIFLLHTLDRESKKDEILHEAETRLLYLRNSYFKTIAAELSGEDPYQFLRAYTAGLQEYVEAMTFYQYINSKSLEGWTTMQERLVYPTFDKPKDDSTEIESEEDVADTENAENVMEADKLTLSSSFVTKTLMPPTDYILGVADLTGELMRKCINNLGSGQIESCFQTCAFVRDIYTGFLSVGNSGPKEMTRKLYTLRQSLVKMENACYTIHVRGSEIPKHMLADVFSGGQDDFHDEDEGFY